MDDRVTEPAFEKPKLKEDTLAMSLLILTGLLLLALLLWLALSYNSLPDLLPLHFDNQGNADRISERREIFVLPGIALTIALANGGVGWLVRDRFGMIFASYLLWAGGLMAQLLIWIAVWNIVH